MGFLLTATSHAHTCQWWWNPDPTGEALLKKVRSANYGFYPCMTGPRKFSSCCCNDCFDVDADKDVDLRDWANYIICTQEVIDNEESGA
jgi:hypothetical protein